MQLGGRLSTLLQLSPQPIKDMIERQTALPRWPDAPTTHASHTLKAPRLYRRSPSNIVTTALREREGSVAIRLGETGKTGGGDGRWGRRLVLGAMLGVLLLVLLGACGN